MLKIGYDAKRLFNNFTGLGNYSRTLLSNLSQYFPDNEYHLYTPKIQQNSRTEPFLEKGSFKIHLPENKFGKNLWRLSGMKQHWVDDGIFLFHGLSHELPIGIQGSKVKSIVTIHDLAFRQFPDFFPIFDRNIYNKKFKYACKHADVIIAISESTKKDIIRFYDIHEYKIKVIYQTCDDTFQNTTHPSTAFKISLPKDYLLYVGSINERKNLLGCVKALELLPNDLRLPLVVFGRGKKYEQKVRAYIANKGLEKWVLFYPNVHFEELKILYQNARLLLYPSFYEGFGLPIIESLFCKTPVITSKVSSLPEAGGAGAYYVNPENFEEIAFGIEKCLGDEDYYQKLSSEGYAHVQKFGAKKVTGEVMDLYHSL